MAKRVQLLRHALAQAVLFVGRIGEVTVDTTNKSARVHDSITPGGFEQARADLVNAVSADNATNGKMLATHVQAQEAVVTESAQNVLDIAAEISNRIADVDAEEARALAAEALLVPLAQKGAANGIASLDAASKILETALLADAAATLSGLAATIAELNTVDGDTAASAITAIAADRVVFNDGGAMKQVALTTLSEYFRVVTEILANKTLASPVIDTAISGSAIDATVSSSTTKIPHSKAVQDYINGSVLSLRSDSAGVLVSASVGVTVTRTATGTYKIDHPLTGNYSAVANPEMGTQSDYTATTGSRGVDYVTVRIYSIGASAPVDVAFNVVLTKQP